LKPTPRLAAAFLILLPLAVYAQSVAFRFIPFDDPLYLEVNAENPYVANGLTWDGLKWAWTSTHHGHWYPLTLTSHMLDMQLFGYVPAGHHAMNVLFHAANGLLLFFLLLRLTGALAPSAFAAALFAVHPMQVESVAWVSERKNLLSMFFGLLCLRAYADYAEKPGAKGYLKTAGLLALGLMSKPSLVTLPFAMLLLDYWPLRRKEPWTKLVVEKLPLLALCVGASAITFTHSHVQGAATLPLSLKCANAAVSYVRYLRRLAWPSHLAVLYPYPDPTWLTYWAGPCLAALAGLTALAWTQRRRRPHLIVGWLWFLGTLVPMIGLVQVGGQAMADRYAYLSYIGLFVAVAWQAAEWGRRAVAGATLAVAALTVAASVQASRWENGQLLFDHCLKVTGPNYVAHTAVAGYLLSQGRFPESEAHARAALDIDPNFGDAWSILGFSLAVQGDAEQGKRLLEKGIALNPRNIEARHNLKLVDEVLVARAQKDAQKKKAQHRR
jgi:protein O-mannosyl-transferase